MSTLFESVTHLNATEIISEQHEPRQDFRQFSKKNNFILLTIR